MNEPPPWDPNKSRRPLQSWFACHSLNNWLLYIAVHPCCHYHLTPLPNTTALSLVAVNRCRCSIVIIVMIDCFAGPHLLPHQFIIFLSPYSPPLQFITYTSSQSPSRRRWASTFSNVFVCCHRHCLLHQVDCCLIPATHHPISCMYQPLILVISLSFLFHWSGRHCRRRC
jgi:hypothetical protein